MADNRTIMINRIANLGSEHIAKMWQNQPNLPVSLRNKVQSTWSKNSAYAAEILNNCAVNEYIHGSGYQVDSASNTAFLITATIYPAQKFASYLLEKYYSGFQSGLGYLGKLEELLDDNEIGGTPFSQFHHWIISGGQHGIWLSCSIGGRKEGSDYDLLVPADPFCNQRELMLFTFLGPAPINSNNGIIRPRSERKHLSDKWVCSKCKRVSEKKSASNTLVCPNCNWTVSGINVDKGYYDAYEIMGFSEGVAHLHYDQLNCAAWKFIRKADLKIKGETTEELVFQFHLNVQKIRSLATNIIGGQETVPIPSILYSAALIRQSFTHASIKNITFMEAQNTIVNRIGGYEKFMQRIIEGYAVQYSDEELDLNNDKKKPWWKFW